MLQQGLVTLQEVAEGSDPQAINEGVEMLGKASEDFAALRMDAAVREAFTGQQVKALEEDF